MKKMSKIIMFIMLTTVIVFLLPMRVTAGYSSWIQTSQADFDAGTQDPAGSIKTLPAGEFELQDGNWLETTTADFDTGVTKDNIDTADGEIKLVKWGYLDQSQTAADNSYQYIYENSVSQWAGQGFKVSTNGFVTKVKVRLRAYDTNMDRYVNLQIRNYLLQPMGVATPVHLPADTVWREYTFNLTSYPYVESGLQYWISIIITSAEGDVEIGANNTNPYPNGYVLYWDGAHWQHYYDKDFYFKLYMNYASGHFRSQEKDMGTEVAFGKFYESHLAGQSYVFQARRFAADTWGDWATVTNGTKINLSNGTKVQYDVTLTSSDGVTNPKVYDVRIDYSKSDGNLISQPHDCGTDIVAWGRLEASHTLNGQTIDYAVRTSSFVAGLSDADWCPVVSGGFITAPVNRYVQWKATLTTTDGTKTPVVDDITVYYSCKPTIPVLSFPTNCSTINDSAPTLSWYNSTDDDGDTLTYRILVDNNSDFSSPEVDVSNITEGAISTSYISPTLVDDTYNWKVCANDGAIDSDWSTTWSFIIDTTGPEILDVGFFLGKSTENKEYFVIGEKIEVRFKEEVLSSTVVPANIRIIDEYGEDLPLVESEIACAHSVITITPSEAKMKYYCATYTLRLERIKDIYNNELKGSQSFSFTTLIPEQLTALVTVEHKMGRVTINNPARTFPQGSKRCYISLTETEIPSLSNYVEGTERILRCYKVDDSGNQIDIDQLDSPVAISIPYPFDTKDKKNLKIYFYNKDTGRWEVVKGSGDGNPDDGVYYVTGEVTRTNIKYFVGGFAAGALIENYCNYPNPFKAGKENTTITYELKKDAKITISIYDLVGQLVRRVEIPKGAPDGGTRGTNRISWDGKNERGRVVANGGYYCVIEANTETGEHMKKVRKIMVIK